MSIRATLAFKNLGIVTIGQAIKFVEKCRPTAKIGTSTTFIRVNALKRELEIYSGENITFKDNTHDYKID